MKKNNSIQGLRAIAFLAVFLLHIDLDIHMSAWAVSIFFVLSGMFAMIKISSSTNAEDVICENHNGQVIRLSKALPCGFHFAIEHIRKKYLLYVCTTALLMIAEIVHFKDTVFGEIPTSVMRYIGRVIMNLTLTMCWIPWSNNYTGLYVGNEINFPTWFFSSLFFSMIVGFPILVFIADNLRNTYSGNYPTFEKSLNNKIGYRLPPPCSIMLTAGLVIILQIDFSLLVRYYTPSYYQWFVYKSPYIRLGDYLIGGCVGLILANSNDKCLSEFPCGLINFVGDIGIMLINFAFIVFACRFKTISISAMYYIIPSAVTVWYVYRERGMVWRILSIKPLVFLGNISGEMYFIHIVAMSCTHAIYKCLFSREIPKLLWVVVAFGSCLMMSLGWRKLIVIFASKRWFNHTIE